MIPIRAHEIFYIDNLYSDEELLEWQEYINFLLKLQNQPYSFIGAPLKNGKIFMPEVTLLMYNRLKHHLPNLYIDKNEQQWNFKGASEHIFYTILASSQIIPLHRFYDYTDNKKAKFVIWTILNDDFKGGEVQFYDEDLNKTVRICPQKGRTIIFDIDTFNTVRNIFQGHKYSIGTELLCAPHFDTVTKNRS